VSLLARTKAANRQRLPFLTALVFCSAAGVDGRLQGVAATGVRVRHKDTPGLLQSGPDGIIATLKKPPPRFGAGVVHVDAAVARMVARAVEQAGIKRSQKARRVGDYELGDLLLDGRHFQVTELRGRNYGVGIDFSFCNPDHQRRNQSRPLPAGGFESGPGPIYTAVPAAGGGPGVLIVLRPTRVCGAGESCMAAIPDDAVPMQQPLGQLERALIDEHLRLRGYDAARLAALSPGEREAVMKEASLYASSRLAEMESRAHFVHELHDGVTPNRKDRASRRRTT
jgi:hypothetical protein